MTLTDTIHQYAIEMLLNLFIFLCPVRVSGKLLIGQLPEPSFALVAFWILVRIYKYQFISYFTPVWRFDA
jgi:hypothetical protein